MIPKFNSDSRRKTYEAEEAGSVEGRFQEDMEEKDVFRNFVRNLLKWLQYISTNIIHYGQETKYFLSKQLGAKYGEGSSIGSQS